MRMDERSDDRSPVHAKELIGRPVRVGAVQVGTVSDVLASRGLAYVLGLEVRGRDGHGHFVPWVAAIVRPDAIGLTSVFSLLSASELTLYVDNGLRVSECIPELLVASDGTLERATGTSAPVAAPATRRSTRFVHPAAKRSMP
jgi:hypothetical protein